jgi:hypothetical protein
LLHPCKSRVGIVSEPCFTFVMHGLSDYTWFM